MLIKSNILDEISQNSSKISVSLNTLLIWSPEFLYFLQERQAREEALSQDEIYRTPTPIPAADSTWLQVQELEVGIFVGLTTRVSPTTRPIPTNGPIPQMGRKI